MKHFSYYLFILHCCPRQYLIDLVYFEAFKCINNFIYVCVEYIVIIMFINNFHLLLRIRFYLYVYKLYTANYIQNK